VRRHAKASTAGSTQRQAGRLGRIFRGAFVTRDASVEVKGSSAPTAGRLGLALLTLSAIVALMALVAALASAASTTTNSASSITDNAATLNGTVNPEGQALSACFFEYGTGASLAQSAPCTPSAGSIPADSSDHAVSAGVSGLQEGTTYYFRLVTTDGGGTVKGEVKSFSTLGLPQISGESALAGPNLATLGAYVDPSGSSTTYHFEWGTSTAYGNRTPGEPDPSVGSGTEPVPVSAFVEGLALGTTYHFRLVASNAFGTTNGPDQTFTTYKDVGLPDGRRYEQVSPVDKNGNDIDPRFAASMAAVDGNRLLFFSRGSFAGQPTTLVEGTDYLATRGPDGWTTQGVDLPGGVLFGNGGYEGFTPDMSKGVFLWPEIGRTEPYDPEAAHSRNLYMRDSASGSYQLLNGTLTGLNILEGFVGGSSDFGQLVIRSSADLIAGKHCPISSDNTLAGQEACAYEWDHGVLRLASILPNGEPVTGAPGDNAFLGSGENVMPADGSRFFFEYPLPAFGKGQLYARENGTSTTLVSASERTLPGGFHNPEFGVDFQDAEVAHGDKVLFTAQNSLVNEDTNKTNDAYLYDFNKPAGKRLTLVSKDQDPEAPDGASIELGNQGHLGGILGASDDMRRIYFVAANQIVAGKSAAPGPKLFLWDDTGASPKTTYIGTLVPGDENVWTVITGGGFAMKKSRLSRDGRFAAFPSTARLTPFDNEGRKEIYRYDAVAGSLDCASCPADPDTETPPFERPNELGGASGHTAPVNRELHNVSDSGQVFFYSEWDLVPWDSNGRRDVYEYDGHLHLISKGTGNTDSTFLDATPSGSDVFFTTGDQLVGWDEDGSIDAYDARVGGGFPEPPLEPPPCEADACQPSAVAPDDQTPASASFNGPGDPNPRAHARRCGKGQVRRQGRCRSRRHGVRHKSRAHSGTRHATRSHG
jgi:hypothetical protein